MQPILLVTNGGPHTARHWADAAAQDIVRVDGDATEGVKAKAAKLRTQVASILEPPFVVVTSDRPCMVSVIVTATVDDLRSVMRAHLADECVAADMGDLLARHFNTARDLADRWRRGNG